MIVSIGRLGLNLLMLLALAALGCSDSDDGPSSSSGDKIADKGDLRAHWETTDDRTLTELVDTLESTGLVESVAEGLNDTLRFPNDLTLAHLDCGEVNAFYSPKDRSVFMCYELLKQIVATVYDPTLTDEELSESIVGTWLFVMFHELGHALIDQYELPITGKEEDAVDDFSTLILIEAGLSDLAVNAAGFWALADDGMYSGLDYADEHSLNPQRFFGILCTVFGSDPKAYGALVTSGILPEARAARCQSEYQQKLASWSKLLDPYAK